MYTRLYFVIPDVTHARRLVSDLNAAGVDSAHIHAVANDSIDLAGLPRATHRQRRDVLHRMEHWLWRANLVTFFLALAGLVLGVIGGSALLIVSMLALAIANLTVGILWVQVPDTGLREFGEALTHQEVLLMVDVPNRRITEIEQLVHKRHPEAVPGGRSWSVDALGL